MPPLPLLTEVPFYMQNIPVADRRTLRYAGYKTYNGGKAGRVPTFVNEWREYTSGLDSIPVVRSSMWKKANIGPLTALLSKAGTHISGAAGLTHRSAQYDMAYIIAIEAYNFIKMIATGDVLRPRYPIDGLAQLQIPVPALEQGYALDLAEALTAMIPQGLRRWPLLKQARNWRNLAQPTTLYWPDWVQPMPQPQSPPWYNVAPLVPHSAISPPFTAKDARLDQELLSRAWHTLYHVWRFWRRDYHNAHSPFADALSAYTGYYAALYAYRYGARRQDRETYEVQRRFAPSAVRATAQLYSEQLAKHLQRTEHSDTSTDVMRDFSSNKLKQQFHEAAERYRRHALRTHKLNRLKELAIARRAAKRAKDLPLVDALGAQITAALKTTLNQYTLTPEEREQYEAIKTSQAPLQSAL